MRSTLLLLSLTLCAGCGTLDPASRSDGLEVSRVVLYQNGVGYLERRGEVNGDVLRLQVRPDQINDLLTSLTVIDMSGGAASSVSLPIERTAAIRMAELPEQVRKEGGVLTLLQAFRGAQVDIRGRDGKERPRRWQGRVVGVEGHGGPHVAVLGATGAVHNIDVARIDSVRIAEKALEVGLRKALGSSLQDGSWKPVDLTVRFADGGAKEVLVGYVVTMPTWKPAYRLVVGDDPKRALLQGWAVVDNTSGEDWRDIALTLTSGDPISFEYDLHTPHFVARPRVAPVHGQASAPVAPGAVAVAAAPRQEEELQDLLGAFDHGMGGIGSAMAGSGMGGGGSGAARIGRKAPKRKAATKEMAPMRGGGGIGVDAAQASMSTAAQGRAAAGLFHYDLAHPVTVPDRSSTLVSLINQRVDGEDVLVYQPQFGGRAVTHPYRSVHFTNDTGYLLQGGPVTVYAGGAFAGEAIFGRIEDGAESFLPYGLETGLSIKVGRKTGERPLRLVSIVDGQIHCEVQASSTREYQFTSHERAARRVYVRVPRRQGWSLQDPPADTRTLPDSYFVPLKVTMGDSTATVTEISPVRRTVGFDSRLGEQVLAIYLEGRPATAELKAQIQALRELKRELGEVATELQNQHRTRNRLTEEQKRQRRNIATLAKAKTHDKLKRQLADKLGRLEKELGDVLARIVNQEERQHQLNKRFQEALRGLRIEPHKP